MDTTTKPRTVNMTAVYLGRIKVADLVGLRASKVAADGVTYEGVIEAPANPNDLYLTLRLADGRWIRLDKIITLI